MPTKDKRDDERLAPEILGLRKADILSDWEHIMAGTLPPGVEGITSQLPSPRSSATSIQSSRDVSPGYHELEFPESCVRGRILSKEERTIPPPKSLLKKLPLEYAGEGATGLCNVFMPGYAPWRDGAYLKRSLEGLPYPLNKTGFVAKYVKPLFDELHQQSTAKDENGVIEENEDLACSIIDTVAAVDREFSGVGKWVDGQCHGKIFSDKTRPALEVSSKLNSTFYGSEYARPSQVNDSGKGKKKASKTKADTEPQAPLRPTDFTQLRKAYPEIRRAYSRTLPQMMMRDQSKLPCRHLRFRRGLAMARAQRRVEELAHEIMAAPVPDVDCTLSSTWLEPEPSNIMEGVIQMEVLS